MHAIHARGSPTPNANVFRYRSDATGKVTEFYAERGMVSVHGEMPDGNEGFTRQSVRTFLERALAISHESKALRAQATRASGTRQRALWQEAAAKQRLVETMVAAARRAREQGDPHDPRVLAHHVAHNRPHIIAVGGGGPHDWSTGMPPPPQAPPGAAVEDLGGTRVVDPARQVIVTGR